MTFPPDPLRFCPAEMLSIAVSAHLMIYYILYIPAVDFHERLERFSISTGVGLAYYFWTGNDGTVVWSC